MELSAYAREIKRDARDSLIKKSNVLGVAVGERTAGGESTGEEAVLVLVKRKLPLALLLDEDRAPSAIGGIRTDVIETGVIRGPRDVPEMLSVQHEAKYRPLISGVSVGHPMVTAGTSGIIVLIDDYAYALSNNHVFANSNDASIGDPVYQPGRIDGGRSGDEIGELAAFIPLRFSGEVNFVDAALVKLDSGAPPIDIEQPERPSKDCAITRILLRGANAVMAAVKSERRLSTIPAKRVYQVRNVQYTDEVLNLPFDISGSIADPVFGEDVHKSGRTTGYTSDIVRGIDVTVNVDYGEGRIARFEDQVLAGAMSAGGDSGSVMFDSEGHAVGLLFAGSDTTTIFTPMIDVFDHLEISKIYTS